MLLNILLWLVLGAVAGWLASLVMGTNQQQGLIGDILVGIVGGLVGGFVFNLIGLAGVTGFNLWSLLVAFLGAVLLLAIARAITGRSARA